MMKASALTLTCLLGDAVNEYCICNRVLRVIIMMVMFMIVIVIVMEMTVIFR